MQRINSSQHHIHTVFHPQPPTPFCCFWLFDMLYSLVMQLSKDLELFRSELSAVLHQSNHPKQLQQEAEQALTADSQSNQADEAASSSDDFTRAIQQ